MDNINVAKSPKIISICGIKNSGKTTLIEKLVKELCKKNFKVAVIKHDGHDFNCDIPGTDSYRFQESGAYGTAVFSNKRIFIHKIGEGQCENTLIPLFPEADIIFIEGMKESAYPKIEVVREDISCRLVSNPIGRFLVVTDLKSKVFNEVTVAFEDIDFILEKILKVCRSD